MPQTETTPFYPRSPYAVAKLYAFWIMKNYRESYGMYTANGILFNHESERRGENFVTRKISMAVARITAGLQDKLYLRPPRRTPRLGLRTRLRGVHVAHTTARATRRLRDSHRRVPHRARVRHPGLRPRRHTAALGRHGLEEKGIDTATGRVLVEVDPRFFRPAEVEKLLGNPAKARRELGWNPLPHLHRPSKPHGRLRHSSIEGR